VHSSPRITSSHRFGRSSNEIHHPHPHQHRPSM